LLLRRRPPLHERSPRLLHFLPASHVRPATPTTNTRGASRRRGPERIRFRGASAQKSEPRARVGGADRGRAVRGGGRAAVERAAGMGGGFL
jgi:hypothetical protein